MSTRPGFTLGAVLGKVASNLLTKADCAAEVLNAPPSVWKTDDSHVSKVIEQWKENVATHKEGLQ